jgi:ABC-type antimicrobial peptide transport system permease subunit
MANPALVRYLVGQSFAFALLIAVLYFFYPPESRWTIIGVTLVVAVIAGFVGFFSMRKLKKRERE